MSTIPTSTAAERTWEEARRLVVSEGWEYERVAAELGLALSTLQKRAAAEKWQAQKKSADSYAATIRALKALALDKAHQALFEAKTSTELQAAAQLGHYWRGLETAYPESRYSADGITPEAQRAQDVAVIEALIAYLEAQSRDALTALAPHITGFMKSREVARG